jgi:hypothetical protein
MKSNPQVLVEHCKAGVYARNRGIDYKNHGIDFAIPFSAATRLTLQHGMVAETLLVLLHHIVIKTPIQRLPKKLIRMMASGGAYLPIFPRGPVTNQAFRRTYHSICFFFFLDFLLFS